MLVAPHLFQLYESPADPFVALSYRQVRKHTIVLVESLCYLPLPLAETASQVLGLVGISYPGGRRWIETTYIREKDVNS